MEKQKVKIEETMSREALAERLRWMALDWENGRLELHGDDKIVLLATPESVPLEIEARHKDNKEKLVIEMSWRCLPAMVAASAWPEATADSATSVCPCGVAMSPPPEEVAEENGLAVPEAPEPATAMLISPEHASGMEETDSPPAEVMDASRAEAHNPGEAAAPSDDEAPCRCETDFIIEETGSVSIAPELLSETVDSASVPSPPYREEPEPPTGETASSSSPDSPEAAEAEMAENTGKSRSRSGRRRG